jgi:hypothetical protein
MVARYLVQLQRGTRPAPLPFAAFAAALVFITHSPLALAQTDEPPKAILGQAESIELSHTERKPSTLTWKTSVGTAVPKDTHVIYRFPKTSYPQVAIVAAYDPQTRSPVVDRVIMVGTPTVEVRSEPNVKVTVRVDEKPFGPIGTDSKGLARLKIEAPPGLVNVKTFATDSYDNVTEGELALNPPPFPRVLVLCAPTEEAAYIVELNERGDFVDTPTFEAHVVNGSATAPEPVSPGIFRLPLQVQNPTPEWKTVTVNVQHSGFSDSCAFKVAPPPPSEPFKLNGTVTPIEPEFTLFVAANAGLSTNFGLLTGPWVSLQGSYPFSSTRDGLRVELTVGYTHSNTDVTTEDGQELELTVDSIPVLVGPRYVFASGLLHLSAAVHGGLSFTSESLIGPLTDQAATATPLWFGGDVGAGYWLGSADVGLNVGYSHAPIEQPDVSGNVAGFRVTVRYERGF